MDQFQLEKDMVNGERIFRVSGEAIERFAQMTNWDYYDASNRFQKTLEAAGEHPACTDSAVKCAVIHADVVAIVRLYACAAKCCPLQRMQHKAIICPFCCQLQRVWRCVVADLS